MMVHLKSPDGFCYQAGIFKNIAKTKHTGDTSFEDKLFLASDEFVLFLECEFVFICSPFKISKRSFRIHNRQCCK